MQLNTDKCPMIFGRSKTLMPFNFYLHSLLLERVTVVNDLGLYMTPSLDQSVLIAKICARANSVLEFIARTSRNTLTPSTLKTLYSSLVQPILEYGFSVWAPHQAGKNVGKTHWACEATRSAPKIEQCGRPFRPALPTKLKQSRVDQKVVVRGVC